MLGGRVAAGDYQASGVLVVRVGVAGAGGCGHGPVLLDDPSRY